MHRISKKKKKSSSVWVTGTPGPGWRRFKLDLIQVSVKGTNRFTPDPLPPVAKSAFDTTAQ